MQRNTTLLIVLSLCLSAVSNKAFTQALTVADTNKLLCQKWVPVSRTINGKQYPIDEKWVPDSKGLTKPKIDTTTFYQFNADKTFECGGMWGAFKAQWQYLSSSRTIELMDKSGKSGFKLARLDKTHLTLETHSVKTNFIPNYLVPSLQRSALPE